MPLHIPYPIAGVCLFQSFLILMYVLNENDCFLHYDSILVVQSIWESVNSSQISVQIVDLLTTYGLCNSTSFLACERNLSVSFTWTIFIKALKDSVKFPRLDFCCMLHKLWMHGETVSIQCAHLHIIAVNVFPLYFCIINWNPGNL